MIKDEVPTVKLQQAQESVLAKTKSPWGSLFDFIENPGIISGRVKSNTELQSSYKELGGLSQAAATANNFQSNKLKADYVNAVSQGRKTNYSQARAYGEQEMRSLITRDTHNTRIGNKSAMGGAVSFLDNKARRETRTQPISPLAAPNYSEYHTTQFKTGGQFTRFAAESRCTSRAHGGGGIREII